MAYDAADGYVLLFEGKEAKTWTFSDDVWTELFPTVSPSARTFACMAYDWADGYVVLYGGGEGGIGTPKKELSDTWTFRGGVWTDITEKADSPPGLAYPSCAYDTAAGYLVLFGGANGRGPTYTGTSGLTVHSTDQTWKFLEGKWTNITATTGSHPGPRFGAAMAYDAADGYVVLYGGAINGTSTANGSCSPLQCPHLNETWKFAGGTWTNLTDTASPAGTPPGVWEAAMSNDSSGGIVIFGGQANGYKSPNATGNYTWVFLGGRWTNVTTEQTFSPAPRFGAAVAFEPETATVVLFSGLGGTVVNTPLRSDTELFYNGEWECLDSCLRT